VSLKPELSPGCLENNACVQDPYAPAFFKNNKRININYPNKILSIILRKNQQNSYLVGSANKEFHCFSQCITVFSFSSDQGCGTDHEGAGRRKNCQNFVGCRVQAAWIVYCLRGLQGWIGSFNKMHGCCTSA